MVSRHEVAAPPVMSPPAAYTISAVRAQLFYSDRGTLSDDILSRSELSLWNTIIGEGSAGGPSNATLVTVELSGKAGSYERGLSVELVVTAGKKPLLSKRVAPGVLNRAGHTYAAFWLYDTGCQQLTLVASIVGAPDSAKKTATIPFQCGE